MVRRLRDANRALRSTFKTIFLCGPDLNIPPEYRREIDVIDLPLPGMPEPDALFNEACEQHKGCAIELGEQRDALLRGAMGLTDDEARAALTRLRQVDGGTSSQHVQVHAADPARHDPRLRGCRRQARAHAGARDTHRRGPRPRVLWIDEIEPAIVGRHGGGADVSTRFFSSFLTWMQQKEHMVLVAATANEIGELPPELLREGRFDEVFFVDLPSEAERIEIL